MTSTLKRLAGNTIKLEVILGWSEIKAVYDRIFGLLLAEVELPGFRRGKAPKDLASKQINASKVYEEVLKEVVPHAYSDALKQHELHPIISPKVEVLEANENKDWKLKITTCEKPAVKLGNYKKAIKDARAAKKTKIWTPGTPKDDKKEEMTLGEVLEAISSEIQVELAGILLEQEVNRMLSNLLNETQKLGITIEQYLQSLGKTSEQLRKEYQEQAQKTLSLEFALEEIAEVEKVTVDNSEIEEVIKNAKTEEERKSLSNQRYYLASLLKRQKTLTQLLKPSAVDIVT